MKRLALVFLVLLVAVAHSEGETPDGGWTPFSFSLPEIAGREAIAGLTEQNDPTLAETIARNPGFARDLPQQLAQFASIALNSVPAPWTIVEGENSTSYGRVESKPSYAFGKTIMNFEIFAMHNAIRTAAPVLEDSLQGLKYRYCETHPTDDECQFVPDYGSFQYTIARRIVSNARFVRAACPAITAYVKWDLQWKIGTPAEAARFRAFSDEFLRILDFIYADGEWSTARLGLFQTRFDRNFYRMLVRRYLDGGPEMIEAIRDCWYGIRSEAPYMSPATGQAFSHLVADRRATAAIDGILRFQSTEAGSGLETASAPLTEEAFYRLTHRLDVAAPLPVRYVPGDTWDTEDRSEYLETLMGYFPRDNVPYFVRFGFFRRMLAQMSALDPVYSYRSLSRAEFARLPRDGDANKKLCLGEGQLLDRRSPIYLAYGDGRIEVAGPYVDGCAADEVKIVRERK